MKYVYSYLPVLFFSSLFSQSEKLTLEGAYLGTNVYIHDPFAPSGKGFCTQFVLVNGDTVPFTESSAYEIRLDSFGLKLYDPVKIEIVHHSGCTPKVLHTDNGHRTSTFEIIDITLDSTGLLKWKTTREISKFIFTIELFAWNKWITVGETDGKGGLDTNTYEQKIFLHSGENKVRVKQTGHSMKYRVSEPAVIHSPKKEVKLLSDDMNSSLAFSDTTRYELYDTSGNIITKGLGQELDCKKLKKGSYYLHYDNREMVMRKK